MMNLMSNVPNFPGADIFDQGKLNSIDPLENQLCRVCEEPAAGFHFGAFTCEGCKSFFGRSCNNQTAIPECKNNYRCVVDKKNRTACKACRLRKCLLVGMSKSGCRYGRRSNWFKIHCLMQKNLHQMNNGAAGGGGASGSLPNGPPVLGGKIKSASAAPTGNSFYNSVSGGSGVPGTSLTGHPSVHPAYSAALSRYPLAAAAAATTSTSFSSAVHGLGRSLAPPPPPPPPPLTACPPSFQPTAAAAGLGSHHKSAQQILADLYAQASQAAAAGQPLITADSSQSQWQAMCMAEAFRVAVLSGSLRLPLPPPPTSHLGSSSRSPSPLNTSFDSGESSHAASKKPALMPTPPGIPPLPHVGLAGPEPTNNPREQVDHSPAGVPAASSGGETGSSFGEASVFEDNKSEVSTTADDEDKEIDVEDDKDETVSDDDGERGGGGVSPPPSTVDPQRVASAGSISPEFKPAKEQPDLGTNGLPNMFDPAAALGQGLDLSGLYRLSPLFACHPLLLAASAQSSGMPALGNSHFAATASINNNALSAKLGSPSAELDGGANAALPPFLGTHPFFQNMLKDAADSAAQDSKQEEEQKALSDMLRENMLDESSLDIKDKIELFVRRQNQASSLMRRLIKGPGEKPMDLSCK